MLLMAPGVRIASPSKYRSIQTGAAGKQAAHSYEFLHKTYAGSGEPKSVPAAKVGVALSNITDKHDYPLYGFRLKIGLITPSPETNSLF